LYQAAPELKPKPYSGVYSAEVLDMLTRNNRILGAGTPAIAAAVILAGTLAASELLSGNSADAEPIEPVAAVHATDVPERSTKGDLKANLADVNSRPMRCVAGEGETTCTGWPVNPGMLALSAQ
jgi:hypothetical protein